MQVSASMPLGKLNKKKLSVIKFDENDNVTLQSPNTGDFFKVDETETTLYKPNGNYALRAKKDGETTLYGLSNRPIVQADSSQTQLRGSNNKTILSHTDKQLILKTAGERADNEIISANDDGSIALCNQRIRYEDAEKELTIGGSDININHVSELCLLSIGDDSSNIILNASNQNSSNNSRLILSSDCFSLVNSDTNNDIHTSFSCDNSGNISLKGMETTINSDVTSINGESHLCWNDYTTFEVVSDGIFLSAEAGKTIKLSIGQTVLEMNESKLQALKNLLI